MNAFAWGMIAGELYAFCAVWFTSWMKDRIKTREADRCAVQIESLLRAEEQNLTEIHNFDYGLPEWELPNYENVIFLQPRKGA